MYEYTVEDASAKTAPSLMRLQCKDVHTHCRTCTHILGGMYEYTVEDASAKTAPSLARRTVLLQQHVVARAAEMKALALGSKFCKPLGGY